MKIKELTQSIDTYLSYSNLLDDNHKVIFLSESKSNINFLIDVGVEKYVFRLNKESKLGLRNQIRYEYDALKTLERSYVTPRTFFLDDSTTFFEYGVLIMQFIEGRPLEYRRDTQEAAKIFGKIHSLDTEKIDAKSFIIEENIIEKSLEKTKRNLEGFLSSSDIDIKVKLKISEFVDWAEKNKSVGKYFKKDKWNAINNTEPHANNFIISDTKKRGYLIDWEKPLVCDPSVDIAYFLSPITTHLSRSYTFSEDKIDDFFKTYIMYLDKCDRDIVERVRLFTPFLYLESLSEVLNTLISCDREKILDLNYMKHREVIEMEFIDKLTADIL